LNHSSLSLQCSWPGGLPAPSLHWTRGLLGLGQEVAGPGREIDKLGNNVTLLPAAARASNNTLYTCLGSHPARNRTTYCSMRTCECHGARRPITESQTRSIHGQLCHFFWHSRFTARRARVFGVRDPDEAVPDAVLLVERGAPAGPAVVGRSRGGRRGAARGGELQHPGAPAGLGPERPGLHLPRPAPTDSETQELQANARYTHTHTHTHRAFCSWESSPRTRNSSKYI